MTSQSRPRPLGTYKTLINKGRPTSQNFGTYKTLINKGRPTSQAVEKFWDVQTPLFIGLLHVPRPTPWDVRNPYKQRTSHVPSPILHIRGRGTRAPRV
jgi:hypothetical protein